MKPRKLEIEFIKSNILGKTDSSIKMMKGKKTFIEVKTSSEKSHESDYLIKMFKRKEKCLIPFITTILSETCQK